MALDVDNETFIMHVAIQEQDKMVMNSSWKAQIEAQSRAQIEALLFDKTPTDVLAEYSDYNNVFSTKNAAELSENTRINEHTIKLEEG